MEHLGVHEMEAGTEEHSQGSCLVEEQKEADKHVKGQPTQVHNKNVYLVFCQEEPETSRKDQLKQVLSFSLVITPVSGESEISRMGTQRGAWPHSLVVTPLSGESEIFRTGNTRRGLAPDSGEHTTVWRNVIIKSRGIQIKNRRAPVTIFCLDIGALTILRNYF